MIPRWRWIPMTIPRPWGAFRRIVLGCMTWEETYGSGVRTYIRRMGPFAWFVARRGTSAFQSVCCRRIATMAIPTLVLAPTVSGVFLGLRVRLSALGWRIFYAKAFICKF